MFSSPALLPESVGVGQVTVSSTRVPGANETMAKMLRDAEGNRVNTKFVAVETTWNRSPATFDTDGTLRVVPTQVQLITVPKDGGGNPTIELPVAFRGRSIRASTMAASRCGSGWGSSSTSERSSSQTSLK